MKQRKVRKVKPYTRTWEKEATELAVSWCPPIHPCKDCGHPVIEGYCCSFCKSSMPR